MEKRTYIVTLTMQDGTDISYTPYCANYFDVLDYIVDVCFVEEEQMNVKNIDIRILGEA